MAAEEEESRVEIEAVESVYGQDVVVIRTYPPSINVHIAPRTADVSSQQFVEAVLGIQAGHQYPEEPPDIKIIDCKGLDEKRQKHLVNDIQEKARELSSCFMLVALCEEAVERLTSMNHPDGDCPLCLYPLLDEEAGDEVPPFMKLMSCFHCFHRECFIRWWNWIQKCKECESTNSSGSLGRSPRKLLNQQVKETTGSCPVCRKVFHVKDMEHVLDMVGAYDQSSLSDTKVDETILQSDSERIRRDKFEAILKVQEENSGLNESKKTEVLRPDMFLPAPTPQTPLPPAEETSKLLPTGTDVHYSSNMNGFPNRASTSGHRRNSGTRKRGGSNSRTQQQKWVQK